MPIDSEDLELVLEAGPDEAALQRLLADWRAEQASPDYDEDWGMSARDVKNLIESAFNRPAWQWALPTLLDSDIFGIDDRLSEYDNTLLYTAVESSDPAWTSHLLRRGADPNIGDKYGSTPLFVVYYGSGFSPRRSYEKALLLLDHGADVNHRDKEGRTALNYAYLHSDALVYRLLTTRGAVWGATDALPPPLHHHTLLGNAAGVRECLANGSLVESFDDREMTPLDLASLCGNREMVQLLLTAGASVDLFARLPDDCSVSGEKNHSLRNTPLHYAASRGHTGIADILLAAGADINAVDSSGGTPLQCAGEFVWGEEVRGAEAMMRFLIERGADPTLGSTLAGVCHLSAESVVELLLAGHTGTWSAEDLAPAVRSAKCCSHFANLKPLARYGADVSVAEAVRWTGDVEIVRAAIARGRDINEREFWEEDGPVANADACKSPWRETPLMRAAELGRADLIRLLLEHGADPNRLYRNHETALDLAEAGGHAECATLLRSVTKQSPQAV